MLNWRFLRARSRKCVRSFFLLVTILGSFGCFSSYYVFWFHPERICPTHAAERKQPKSTKAPEPQISSLYDVKKTSAQTFEARLPMNSSKHKTTLLTTTTCKQHYFLLILVSSAPSNFKRRRGIRETWGADTFVNPRWKIVFLVAQTQNPIELNSLLKESETYGDLVRGNYIDNYFNQTLKIRMGFEWAVRYCKFSFLLKMDDDTFVNTRSLMALLKDPNTPQEKLFMGRVAARARPYRSGKFEVSKEQYSGEVYPPFCPGFGVVFSADVIALFVNLFDVVPPFKLDDVYIGILADKAGLKARYQDGFDVKPLPQVRCASMDGGQLVRHGVEGDCLLEVYRKTINI